jgi:DNA modification methylase
MNKRADAAEVLFDPAEHLPEGLGEIRNHQTELPRIARDKKLVAQIEAKLEQLPTHHDLYRRDSRKIDFLGPESVHLVVTSPPYWTLKDYNVSEGQMGYIEDYDKFLDELD